MSKQTSNKFSAEVRSRAVRLVLEDFGAREPRTAPSHEILRKASASAQAELTAG